MRRIITLLTLVLTWPVNPVSAQTPSTEEMIFSPKAGEVLQGLVEVTGTSARDGFASAELSFAYSGDAITTWFPVAFSSQPITSGTLAIWDTTVITDGNYTLRLMVTLIDGTILETFVPNLRVRNYTSTETCTPTLPPTNTPNLPPTLTPILPTLTATPFPTKTTIPTPTALEENPSILPAAEISRSIFYGGLTTILFLLILVLYIRLRRN